MNISDILKVVLYPLKKLDAETSELVAEKAAVGAQAALAEAPILNALLKGEEVELTVKLQLKAKV
jgi:hypothetical protein